ncbi:MAG: DsbA family protein [Sphingobacteriaceae bacterium]|jgi:putative protein-disulfide isomerase|nr:DsbA family protein [Sphingobacteriaceae bacterium]
MEKLKIIYVYDALCGWCYGFSPVIKSIYDHQQERFDFEVLSGGMMLGDRSGPVGVVAAFIQTAYKTVEQTTGIVFGEPFLSQLERGEMIFDSEKPAIALSTFKSYQPDKAIVFAHDIQNSLYFEGRDLNDDDVYRYHAVNFGIDPDEFVYKMQMEEFKQAAYYDFALARQLGVTGYPAVLLQNKEEHFYLLARGFTDLETLEARIENVLKELGEA